MAGNTKIEWTEKTWNPVTGCTKISDGCKNCYAEKMAKRLNAMGNPRYENGFEVTMHEDLLTVPLKWNKSAKIFVNSMSDLFHEDIPFEYIQRVFNTMNLANQHVFQILTKRSDILLKYAPHLNWSNNIWMGVTIESDKYKYRIDDLAQIPAKIKFISFEPLIERVNNPDLSKIDWAIIGGESGVGARPIIEEWVIHLKNVCDQYDTAFYFKQWGGKNKKKTGRELLGQTWDAYPVV
ncbi:MAG: phage Gp37/Gp68 family protein [Acetobacterium sp.]|uniref:DUF5131 family protein n=1 Tax=Acetobacterium sp. TaxID=1872094 RepID=UPI00324204E7